jgi:hypothetical protein
MKNLHTGRLAIRRVKSHCTPPRLAILQIPGDSIRGVPTSDYYPWEYLGREKGVLLCLAVPGGYAYVSVPYLRRVSTADLLAGPQGGCGVCNYSAGAHTSVRRHVPY